MKSIGVFVNREKKSVPAFLRKLEKSAKKHGVRLVAAEPEAELLPSALNVPAEELPQHIEALLVLGGDGTMLNAVRFLAGRNVPMLGINLGSLGFLTSVAEDKLEQAVACLAQGNWSTTRHRLVECRHFRGNKLIGRYRALNDIVVERGASSRIATLTLRVDNEDVCAYRADGLIVATPTGSTGHSLSAGGPIILPESRILLVSLICPHTLSSRPLAIPDNKQIQIGVAHSAGPLQLLADGRACEPVRMEDRLEIKSSPRPVRFIHLPDYSYFAVLRQKLHWRGSALES